MKDSDMKSGVPTGTIGPSGAFIDGSAALNQSSSVQKGRVIDGCRVNMEFASEPDMQVAHKVRNALETSYNQHLKQAENDEIADYSSESTNRFSATEEDSGISMQFGF